MLKFINVKTGKSMSHLDFVEMVWRKAKERYEKLTGNLWCNIDSYEQNQCYCIQFEDLIRDGWRMFPDEWRFQ